MGTRLLKDFTEALSLTVDRRCHLRLTADDLPALLTKLKGLNLSLNLRPAAALQLLRLVRRYEVHLAAFSDCLVIPLPVWIQTRANNPPVESGRGTARRDRADRIAWGLMAVSRAIGIRATEFGSIQLLYSRKSGSGEDGEDDMLWERRPSRTKV
jgi:hypothetical protein